MRGTRLLSAARRADHRGDGNSHRALRGHLLAASGEGKTERRRPSARRSFIAVWALPELIEAAARSGNGEAASDALVPLTEAASASDSDWCLGAAARSRALLRERLGADSSYRQALVGLRHTRLRPDLARAHSSTASGYAALGPSSKPVSSYGSRTTC